MMPRGFSGLKTVLLGMKPDLPIALMRAFGKGDLSADGPLGILLS